MFGIASSPAKAAYCVERLRFDGAVSYAGKSRDELREELAALLQPYGGGVDGYFDNTGGISTDAVFPLLNLRARGMGRTPSHFLSLNDFLELWLRIVSNSGVEFQLFCHFIVQVIYVIL